MNFENSSILIPRFDRTEEELVGYEIRYDEVDRSTATVKIRRRVSNLPHRFLRTRTFTDRENPPCVIVRTFATEPLLLKLYALVHREEVSISPLL